MRDVSTGRTYLTGSLRLTSNLESRKVYRRRERESVRKRDGVEESNCSIRACAHACSTRMLCVHARVCVCVRVQQRGIIFGSHRTKFSSPLVSSSVSYGPPLSDSTGDSTTIRPSNRSRLRVARDASAFPDRSVHPKQRREAAGPLILSLVDTAPRGYLYIAFGFPSPLAR